MPQVFTLKNRISDIVKWEVSPGYCREAMTVTASGSDVTIEAGTLFVKSTATALVNPKDAVPAIYTVTITRTADSTANDTLIIGGVTFTGKSSPSTASGTTEFALDATAAAVAAIVKAKGLSNYTIVDNGDGTLTYTQTTAGTGDAVTIGTGTGTGIAATVASTQIYAAAVTGNVASLTAIALENMLVPDGETREVLVLVRGPAMYDIDTLRMDATSKTAVQTRLLTLGLVAASEPSVTYTQTT